MKNILLLALTLRVCNLLWTSPPRIKLPGRSAQQRWANSCRFNTGIITLYYTQCSAVGTPVYTETISTDANQFGLVNVQIGSGGNLSVINWANGSMYLQVAVELNNTGGYVDMGTSQLISVPYALFAANSAPGPAGATGPQG